MLDGTITFGGAACVYKMASTYHLVNFPRKCIVDVFNEGERILCKTLMMYIGPCMVYQTAKSIRHLSLQNMYGG